MGLKNDIYQAFEKNLGSDAINATEESKKKVDDLATDLSKAIVDFFQAQELNITEMEAPLHILPGQIQVATAGSPAAQTGVNTAPVKAIAQMSQTTNKIMDPKVAPAVKKSKVKLLKVKEA